MAARHQFPTLPPMSRSSEQAIRWTVVLGWAIYLAVSWTWCIGMFLPILLLRDFGWPGFVAFAAPNVAGAAAMGWVIASPDSSRRFVERHRLACVVFSAATALFHLAFAAFVIFPLDAMRAGIVGTLAVLLAPILLSWLDRPRLVAVCVYAISLGVIAFFVVRGWVPASEVDPDAARALGSMRLPGYEVLLLAPACAFGFLFCPYLDMTFHRARQSLRAPESRLGFGLGFGLFFFAMILFTAAYAPVFTPMYTPLGPKPERMLLTALVLHLSAQAIATIAFHMRSLRTQSSHPLGRGAFWAVAAIALLLAGFILLPRVGSPSPPSFADPDERLIWYRSFMSLYGLVFPAYVWLLAIPTRDGHAGISGTEGRSKMRVLAVAVLLAAPCFWLGFVERQTWWLAPGMAVVLLSRVLITPRAHRAAP